MRDSIEVLSTFFDLKSLQLFFPKCNSLSMRGKNARASFCGQKNTVLFSASLTSYTLLEMWYHKQKCVSVVPSIPVPEPVPCWAKVIHPAQFLSLAEGTARRRFVKVRKPKEGALLSDPVGLEDNGRPRGSPPQGMA